MALSKDTLLKIKSLRTRGFSIPEISKELSISKSTTFKHIKGVLVAPEYRQRLLDRRNASKISSERNWNIAKEKAELTIKTLSDKEMMLVGASLYWAEGAKKDFSFSNTDPEMIRTFLAILRKVFGIKNEDLKISLRLYEDLNKTQSLIFWSKTTGVKLDKSTSINILHGSKNGKLLYGMCRIRVRKGGKLLKEIFSIINRVSKLMPS
jgi:hypothetical protein